MTDCDKVLKNLYELLEEDGSLPICRVLQAHLDACESCARFYKELTEVVELCRNFPEEPISEEHHNKLKDFLRKELHKGRAEHS